jgi:hypothetical protein
MPRTNPRFHYTPGHCRRCGTYVGGIGIDWQCRCETSEPPFWRDEYRDNRPVYTLTMPNGFRYDCNGTRQLQPFYSILRRHELQPITVTKTATTPNGREVLYTRTFNPKES